VPEPTAIPNTGPGQGPGGHLHWHSSTVNGQRTLTSTRWRSIDDLLFVSVNFSEIACQPQVAYNFRFPFLSVIHQWPIRTLLPLIFHTLFTSQLLAALGLIHLQSYHNRGCLPSKMPHIHCFVILFWMIFRSFYSSLSHITFHRLTILISLNRLPLSPFPVIIFESVSSSVLTVQFLSICFFWTMPAQFGCFRNCSSLKSGVAIHSIIWRDSQKRFWKRETQKSLLVSNVPVLSNLWLAVIFREFSQRLFYFRIIIPFYGRNGCEIWQPTKGTR